MVIAAVIEGTAAPPDPASAMRTVVLRNTLDPTPSGTPSTADAPLRVSVTALGCKVNFAEMADLAGQLSAAGCEVVREDEPADVCVLNSCTVTLQADAGTRQRLHRLRRDQPGAHLVLTGCSVNSNAERYATPGTDGVDSVFDNAAKPAIADHVIALARARRAPSAPAVAPQLRSRAFLKVQDGCNHRCTYCIVTVARGESRSVPLQEVVARAQTAEAAGYREIVLTGIDLGSWGRGEGGSLAALVRALLEATGVRVRLSSVNANDVTDELAALNAHPRLCPHWHLPLQSGSDAVLRAMHRGYRRRQFLRVADALREADPETELTTDIMAAFPGEREEDHAQTLDLIERAGFLHCHVFRWSPRPGTAASARSGRVDDATAQRRSRELRRAAAHAGLERRRRALGRVHSVIWDRVADGEARGISATWHTLRVPASPSTTPGAMAQVLATSIDGETLLGAVIDEPGNTSR